MQEQLRSCLVVISLLVVGVMSAQQTIQEAVSSDRFKQTQTGEFIATFNVADIATFSRYIHSHDDVALLQYDNGDVTIISDNPTRLSTISYLFNLTQKPRTLVQPKFTSILQSSFSKASTEDNFDVVITVFRVKDLITIQDYIESNESLNKKSTSGKSLFISGSKAELQKISAWPEISSMDLMDEKVQPLNYESRMIQRTNVLNSGSNVGGYDLSGAGVTIGVGDGGELGEHVDFGSRVINQANGTYASFGAHGDHVAGIVGASGVLNPRHRGVAHSAQIITQKTTQIIANAEDYAEAYGMSLTNNSYGVSFNCQTNGTYNYNSVNLDYMSRMNPKLLHIFAAGNNGTRSCEGYPDGYNTVLRNYQSSKNVITVGATNDDRTIANISARGPVADGRIKPEIVANGMNIISTGGNYDYFSNNGTSMASPALTGTLALLVEHYRNINNDEPDAGLLKGIICNTADDIGNIGPDYSAGFGLVNARRAAELITEGRHAQGNIINGNIPTHQLIVPEGVSEVKVMLYWHDMEAAAYAEKTLVNDLDLRIVDANQQIHYPWILNTDPAKVNQPAVKGVDVLNNIEQVSIKNPIPGPLTIVVDGGKVPFDYQQYYLTYEFIYSDVTLTHPIGSEIFSPNSYELINWDAEPSNTELFKLSYSNDNGSSWLTLKDNIPSDQRSYAWNVPANMTESALIKIEKSSGSEVDQSLPFKIRQNVNSLDITPICEGMISFDWQYGGDVNYNTSILQISDEEIIELGISSTNEYILDKSLSAGEDYWFALNYADNIALASSRTIAQVISPTYDATCPWANDIKLSGSAVKFTGRANSSRSTVTIQIPIHVKNIGSALQEQTQVVYNLNGTQVHTIPTTLQSGDTYTYNLINTIRDLDPGVYPLDIYSPLPDDPTDNNILEDILTIEMLPNSRISIPFELDLTSAEENVYDVSQIGIAGIERLDFFKEANGQLGVADIQGSKTITLSSSSMEGSNSIDLMFNLKGRPVSEPLLFHLEYSKAGTGQASILLRGNDQSEWINLTDLPNTDDWINLVPVDIAEVLNQQGQQFSSNTQIRIGLNSIGEVSFKSLRIDGEEVEMIVPYESNLSSFQLDDDISLMWSNNLEYAGYTFEIQYAVDSLDLVNNVYEVLATVQGYGSNPTGWTYKHLLEGLDQGKDYFFRVRTMDTYQVDYFTNIIKISMPRINSTSIEVFESRPQTLVISDLNYKLLVPTRTRVGIRLVNDAGRTLFHEYQTYDSGEHTEVISESKFGQNGLYFLEVSTAENTESYTIVVQ